MTHYMESIITITGQPTMTDLKEFVKDIMKMFQKHNPTTKPSNPKPIQNKKAPCK